MYLPDLAKSERARLAAAFAAAADRSRLESFLRLAPEELDRRHLRLGEGTHMTAWRLKGVGAEGLELVLKRPHGALGDPTSPAHRKWTAALSRARDASPLLPPWLLLSGGDGALRPGTEPLIGLVMPYGPDPLSAAAAPWQPLAEAVRALHADLARIGLRLDDVVQGRSWQGIPFVHDLSDLVSLSGR